MNLSTLLVLLGVALWVVVAIRSIRNDRKNGKSSCGGDCGQCGGGHMMCSDPKALIETIKKEQFNKS